MRCIYTLQLVFPAQRRGQLFCQPHSLHLSCEQEQCDNCSSMDEEENPEAQGTEPRLRKTQANLCQKTDYPFHRLFSLGTRKFLTSAHRGSDTVFRLWRFSHRHFPLSSAIHFSLPAFLTSHLIADEESESKRLGKPHGRGLTVGKPPLHKTVNWSSASLSPSLRDWQSQHAVRKHFPASFSYGTKVFQTQSFNPFARSQNLLLTKIPPNIFWWETCSPQVSSVSKRRLQTKMASSQNKKASFLQLKAL